LFMIALKRDAASYLQ